MKAHKKYDALQFIRSMCTDRLSFDTNFFMLSFTKHGFSHLAETVILVIDYAQLFSQIFLLNHYFYDTSTDPFNTLYQKITPIAKTFCTGHWLSFNSADSTILYLVFALMILYLVIKYLLLAYILIIAAKRYQPFKPFLMVWRFICKLHDRVLYLFYTSFWINIFIAASNEQFDPFGVGSAPTMTAAMVIIIVEFLGSFLVNQRYAYLLPTQSILSTQNTNPIIMNLFFKFLLQIFEFSLNDNDKTSIIVFNSLALVLSIVNTIYYFRALPLYNFRALKLEACFMMEALLLNTTFFIRGVINVAGDTVFTVDSAVLLAFALTPLTVKGGMAYINRIVLNLATRNVYTEPELLVHKINAIKHYQQKQKPFTQFSEAYDRAYLVNASYSNRVTAVFDVTNLEDSDKALSIDSRGARDKVFRMFLENLASQFPKDNLIKLYLSYYQGTKFKAYGYALKTLFQLEQHASAKMALNATVLIADIQDTLKEEYKNTKSEIDLSTFITSLAAVSAFKEKILEQTELQIKICREFSENAPDLAKIFNLSQKVGVYKENLEKNMYELRGRLLEYNLEPQVLCARYYLVLNHSIMEYIKTIKNLNKKRERYAKQLTEGKLSAESLYNKENAFMMITTQGGSTGTVIHSSRSAEDLFGDNPAGNNAYSIAPPVLQNFFFEFFKNPLDKRNKEFFGHVVRTFAYHKKGKIVEVDFYMNFHPFLSQGLYYNLIVKPIHSTREFIIIGKNGMIEGFTEEIGEKLGLTLPQGTAQKTGSNINQISRELGRLSHICMTVAALEKGKIQERFTQISSRSDAKQTFQPFSEDVEVNQNDEKTQDAKVLYSIFNTEGKPLKLSAISNTHRSNRSGLFSSSLVYHCRVQNQFYGSTYIQVLTLEESVADDEEVDQTKQLVWASPESGGGTVVQKLLESQSTTKKGTRQETFKTMERRGSPLFNTMLTTFKTDGLQEDNFMGSEDVSFEKRSEFQISDIPDEHGRPMERTTGLLNLSQMEKTSPRKEFKASSSRQEESDTNKLNNDTPIPQGKAEADLHDKWVQDDKNAVAKLQVVQQSLGSQKSRSSAQGRVSKALNEALSVNYSPRYYNMFILGFYALLAGIFATELSSTLTLDTDIGNRKEEKDIIRSSETRNDLLVSIQRELRYIQDLTSGRMTQADLGLVGNTVDGYVSSIRGNLAQLATFNNELLQATNNLDEEFRDQLFGANVRVFETTNFSDPDQSYILLNNFQATSRIVETGLKGLDFVNTDISAANQQFMFIFRNALNDFLITCDKISDIFMESLDRKEQNTLSKLDYILYVTIILLVILVGVSGVVIALQYDNERKNMLAFIKLSPEKVQEVLEGMLRFKRVILEDLNFEEITNVDISKFMKATSKTDAFSKKKGKGHQSTFIQHTNIQGIFRKYLFYMVQILFLTAVLSGFVALNYTTFYNTIVSLHQQLHQIQFSDQLSVRLNVAVITTQELLTNGDTTLIRNQLPSVQVELSLEDIMTIRQELTSSFDASGTSYEATLQNIVYTDACDYLTGTPALACAFTKRGAEQLGLVNAASELESGIAMRIDMYDQSNKTAAALVEIQKDTLENTVYPNSIMNSGTSVISDLIEKYYDADLITAKNKSSLLFGVFCGVISVVGLMAWLGVLMKIRRADGEFKKVLQTLPPNLILSNFMLKSYLLKTSGGVLDVVRNEL